MKHHKRQRKLGRVRKVRVALLRSLARALILNGQIETSVAKAKELRPFVEKLVTIARKNTVVSRRIVEARLGNDKEASKKLHEQVAPNFINRAGGYTRIVKLGKTADVTNDKAVIAFVEK